MGVVDREDEVGEVAIAGECEQRTRDRGEGGAGIEVAGEHPGERAERQRRRATPSPRRARCGSALGPMRSERRREQARLPDPAVADEHGADSAALDEGELRVAPDERPTAFRGVPAHESRVGVGLRSAQGGRK